MHAITMVLVLFQVPPPPEKSELAIWPAKVCAKGRRNTCRPSADSANTPPRRCFRGQTTVHGLVASVGDGDGRDAGVFGAGCPAKVLCRPVGTQSQHTDGYLAPAPSKEAVVSRGVWP